MHNVNKLFIVIFLLCAPFFFAKSIHGVTINNDSFESGQNGWQTTTSTVTSSISTTDAKEGTQSARISYASTTSQGLKQSSVLVTSDTSYQLSGFIKPIDAKKALIRIAWYQAGNTAQLKTEDTPIITTANEWSPAQVTITSPSNAATAEIRLLVSEGAALFDSISLGELAVTPTPTSTMGTLITPTPTINASTAAEINKIYISEVFPYPNSGEYEWIELYNDNDLAVQLFNWYLDDAAATGAAPKKFSLSIPKKGYATLELTSPMFNNDGDMVRLLNSENEEYDTVSFLPSEKNKSVGRIALTDTSLCIQSSTKNAPNSSCILMTLTPTKTPALAASTKIKITPTPRLSAQSNNVVSSSVNNRYHIVVTPPDMSIIDAGPDTLGVTTTRSETPVQSQSSLPPYLSLLAGSYSLLSIISISVKMIM